MCGRSESAWGWRSDWTSTSAAAWVSSGVRRAMNTGLPRQAMVMRRPTWIGFRPMSVVDCASTSADGFKESMNGHSARAVPTAAVATAA